MYYTHAYTYTVQRLQITLLPIFVKNGEEVVFSMPNTIGTFRF